ncbi:CTD small phosphatase-like protein 2 [Dichanthelium oligosanthes]|uniref:CTD small phosphatase-like protein 2 n=1 Tax=Dichanthelium oligosanthes TaxID=888268 RepID=A0A1E5VS22_9POAL|nr:CTD small phosphatase-like protein 2 [Dichanthelium oligosanthes]
MPALRMKRIFDDTDFANEFNTKTVKSMKISHFHDSELEQSAVLNSSDKVQYGKCSHGQSISVYKKSDPTIQLADQDIRVMEASGLHDLHGGKSVEDLTSEVLLSPNSEADSSANYGDNESLLHVVNYVDKEFADGGVDYSAQNFCTVDDHEASLGSNQCCSLLDIYSPDDDFRFLFDSPADPLPSYTGLCDEFVSIDALMNVSSRCGVFPLIESATEASIDNKPHLSEVDLCFSNSEVLEWLNPHLSEEDLPDLVDFAELNSNAPPATKEQGTRKVTLVLDLDETLVHSTMEQCDDADFTFPVFYDMKEHVVYVKKRPHVHMFLRKMAEMFEVVIFTASQSVYANQLLDMLDPENKLFSKRFFRESCLFTDSGYTKDLSVVGVDLAKVAIIDNTPQVFQLQVNNGIPIESWYNNPADDALPHLIPFLETLAVADDVRPIIAKKFGNRIDGC